MMKGKNGSPSRVPEKAVIQVSTRTQSARHRSEIASPDQEWDTDGLHVSSTLKTVNYALLEIHSVCLFDIVFLIFLLPYFASL